MSKNIPVMWVLFKENRQSKLIKKEPNGGFASFSDAIDLSSWAGGALGISIISFNENLCQYIALIRKGKCVVTSKNRVEFSSIVDLGRILVSMLNDRSGCNLPGRFTREGLGFSPVSLLENWEVIIDAIKAFRPHVAKEIDRLVTLSQYSGYSFTGRYAEILLQEREALGAALDIFSGGSQLRQQVLNEWAPNSEMVVDVDDDEKTAALEAGNDWPAFMEGISERYLDEESAIQHDLYNWLKNCNHRSGVSCFTQGDRCLSVFYANRKSLEEVLGVDLIYYDQKFELFVLVQYKLMQEGGYRPDAQMEIELDRMDRAYNRLRRNSRIESESEYRLNDDGFMFKLVPNKGLMPASGELIKGMYIPREYMHFLIGEHGPKGVRGGRLIAFENTNRYLTNTQFAEFIQSGLIGSRGVQSDALKDILRDFFECPRSIVLAYESQRYF